jgi:hypothetical protein
LFEEYGSLKPKNFEGGGDMAESLFMALKKPATRVNKFLRKDGDNSSTPTPIVSTFMLNNLNISYRYFQHAEEIDSAVSPLQFGMRSSPTKDSVVV